MAAEPLFFTTPAQFGAWLATHGGSARELVVGFVKTHTGRANMTWPQSVDEALCAGWIDGVRTRIDADHYKIRFTPRKPGSHWSTVNIRRVAELQAAGRMSSAGLAAFALRTEARSGRASYEQADAAELTPAQLAAFRKNPAAWAFYEALPPGYRHQVNWRVISAKREDTREKRFRALVADCEAGRRR